MYYRIRHLTRYVYSAPVHESLTEVRMHPRTEGQRVGRGNERFRRDPADAGARRVGRTR